MINAQRLLDDLHALRGYGASGNGVVRTTFSEVDMAARHWLAGRMADAGLDAAIDGVGNVYGRSRQPGRCLLLGSHTDTQPTGGWLDGALGVICGLEVARALAEHPATCNLAVDVASWADEESSYLGMIGSRSFCGLLDDAEIARAIGRDGRSLPEALRDCGLSDRPRVHFDPQRHAGYLEAHIEQGPYLEAQQKSIGVVTAIIGMRDYEIVFRGQQNHAGTTPMSLRRDAGMALITFASELNQAVGVAAGERTVWTVGKVEFEPGAPSIIPGRARMLWQFRDPEQARIEALEQLTLALVARYNRGNGVQAELRLRDNTAQAAVMDAALRRHLAHAAERHCPGRWLQMPSGAAHDAQTLASCMPAAMLFIPSINGISHSFEEDSHEHDIVLGCRVMADAVAAMLRDR